MIVFHNTKLKLTKDDFIDLKFYEHGNKKETPLSCMMREGKGNYWYVHKKDLGEVKKKLLLFLLIFLILFFAFSK